MNFQKLPAKKIACASNQVKVTKTVNPAKAGTNLGRGIVESALRQRR
jgi:hypothetical protein